MIFFKKNLKFFFIALYVFFLYCFVEFPVVFTDPLANYGFSHAIINGQIPYLDFNIISTPLFAFIMSLGLLIKDHFIVFLIENAILVAVMFYFLYQLFEDKIYILLFELVFVSSYVISPTYNFLTLLFLVVLLFLEKKYPNYDYWIGFLIGLLILSKHTIGCFLVIPSFIYYFKKPKKIFKRFIGLLIPLFLFFIYLLITNSLISFIDLGVFGLFDFANKNGRVFSIWFVLSLILFIINVIVIIKDRKNILNTYYLFSILFAFPLFNFHHFSIYLFCFVMMILYYVPAYVEKLKYVFILLTIVYTVLLGYSMNQTLHAVTIRDIPRFQYLRMDKESYSNTIKFFELFDQYSKKEVLSSSSMMYDISRNERIDYYDVFLYGNYGYHGTEKMIEKIEKTHGTYYIIDLIDYHSTDKSVQFNKEIAKYVMKNCELVEEKDIFAIYYKE